MMHGKIDKNLIRELNDVGGEVLLDGEPCPQAGGPVDDSGGRYDQACSF